MSARFLISAAASGSGKTLLTCGILQALLNQGKKVVSFKCGPDYIDPMFHSRVIGTKSRNLDTFFAGDDVVRYLLAKNSEDCDIAVLEGVMGYYDGVGGTTVRASAYDVARATDTPVIFIVNCKGASVSLVPAIKGFLDYQPEISMYKSDRNVTRRKKNNYIRGIILNQISPMLYPRMKTLIEDKLDAKVVGYVPYVPECVFESRHLGLVLPEEICDLKERIGRLAGVLEKTIDWESLWEIAEGAKPLNTMCDSEKISQSDSLGKDLSNMFEVKHRKMQEQTETQEQVEPQVRIGVAKDEAFCFFYEDNFDMLRQMGAEIVWFSPLHDKELPKHIDGLMFHGGYPELYAKKLSENKSMLQAVSAAVKAGMPCMAECGGFMYLHEQMEDMDRVAWPMAGVIPGYVRKTDKLGRFGYITLEGGNVFHVDVGPIPSHEFHYFDSDCCGDAFVARKPESTRNWKCIHSTDTLLAGFPHLYFYANPKVAQAFLAACRMNRANRRKA